MDYRQIDRLIREFKKNRDGWLEILNMTKGEHTDAAMHIITINSKIELLRGQRVYPDDYEGEFE